MIHDIPVAGAAYVALLSRLPQVGSMVCIRTTDHPKRSLPYTIERYYVGSDRVLMFKAYDLGGIPCMEPVTLLLH